MNVPETVSQLTLTEKAILITGGTAWSTAALERLGVPSLVLTDGPHGVRRLVEGARPGDIHNCEPATAFPTASATGSSWDPELLEAIGAALGAESRALGVDVLLGPGVNIKRSPLCGRNFEYFSEDPLLSAELGVAWVRGVQSAGVGASVKHFAVNNQETNRMRVSAEADERTLREIYLPAFETIVREARPATVMAAYNAVNGVRAAENEWLLTHLLRAEWGFGGVVVSDWGAVSDIVASLQAGLDLEMPGSGDGAATRLTQAVRTGALNEADLDRAAYRVLSVVDRLRRLRGSTEPAVDADAHHLLARRAATESAVLLTNSTGLLPLDPARPGRLAVIGEFARTPRFQGGGSSHVKPTRLETAVEELTRIVDGRREIAFAPGFSLDGSPPPGLFEEAVAVAREATDVLIFLGLPEAAESEGFDRESLDLPKEQLELLRAVSAVNPRIAVVLSNGGVVPTREIEPYAQAMLEMWLGGQASGGAVAEIVFGVAEPGGRLAETIPLTLSDTPSYVNFPGTPRRVLYGERVYVGYRWYDKTAREVAHPFGHGLSYTTFAYSELIVTVREPDYNEVTVVFTVTNTGQRAGSEVAQVYVTDVESSVDRPDRELKAFRKMRLAAGESRRVELTLSERSFAFWDERRNAWTVEPGVYRVSVGASSRDLRLSADVELTASPAALPLALDSTVGEWMDRPAARDALLKAMAGASEDKARTLGDDPDVLRMVASMPLRRVFTLGRVELSADAETDLLRRANEVV